MSGNKLLARVSALSGADEMVVENVYEAIASALTEELSEGRDVELPGLGRFIAKLWDNPGLNENSPRTKSEPRYKLRFRPSKELEQRLIIVNPKN